MSEALSKEKVAGLTEEKKEYGDVIMRCCCCETDSGFSFSKKCAFFPTVLWLSLVALFRLHYILLSK